MPTLCESTHRRGGQGQEVPFKPRRRVISELGQVGLEGQESKIMLGYIASLTSLGYVLSRVPTMTYFLQPGPTYSRFQHFPQKAPTAEEQAVSKSRRGHFTLNP